MRLCKVFYAPRSNYLMIACQLLVIFSGAGGYLSLDSLLFS